MKIPTVALFFPAVLTQAWVSPASNPSSCAFSPRGMGTAVCAAGGDSDTSSTPWAEIVGSGRIGSLLAEGGNCVVLGRQDTINPDGTGPILIATRNDALAGIVDKCPENRKKDLVFLQNGYLDDFLREKDLLDNTQALLYLSVTAKGVPAVDGVTTVNPEGLTAATGIHAQALADRLAALNLKCKVISSEEYRPAMFEKLMYVTVTAVCCRFLHFLFDTHTVLSLHPHFILLDSWISTYMLVGTAKGCKSVGQAGAEHAELVETVVIELVSAVSAKEGITFPSGTMQRLAAYTDVVSNFPCAVKEFEWRNQYFYRLGDQAVPTHNALLRECAEKGLLGFKLP